MLCTRKIKLHTNDRQAENRRETYVTIHPSIYHHHINGQTRNTERKKKRQKGEKEDECTSGFPIMDEKVFGSRMNNYVFINYSQDQKKRSKY